MNSQAEARQPEQFQINKGMSGPALPHREGHRGDRTDAEQGDDLGRREARGLRGVGRPGDRQEIVSKVVERSSQ